MAFMGLMSETLIIISYHRQEQTALGLRLKRPTTMVRSAERSEMNAHHIVHKLRHNTGSETVTATVIPISFCYR